MHKLTDDDGIIYSDQFEILREQRKFYKNLYAKRRDIDNLTEEVNTFLLGCETPKLSEEDSRKGLLTTEELSHSLNLMNNGSASGCDGLTTEFYKIFWLKLQVLLTKVFNEAFNKKEMSYTQKQGIIMHKGKDLTRDKITNWRPITLLNTDYKLIAKAMGQRLVLVIGNLINEDQV